MAPLLGLLSLLTLSGLIIWVFITSPRLFRLAQLRAGETSKSKILIAKFKSAEALDGWEVRQGTFRTQLLLNMMVGWMLSLSSLNLRELSFQVYTAPSESKAMQKLVLLRCTVV
ncbi:hypothetical protein Bca101_069407 [Brassica carinata]